MPILVAYGSKYGSTQGIAERVAATLTAEGHVVALHPARKVPDVASYEAYVVGGATYMGSWIPDCSDFVKRNAVLLAARPLWLFASGPLGTARVDSKGRDVIVSAEPKEFADYRERLNPTDVTVFFGALFPDKLSGRDKLVRKMPSAHELLPEGDFRDWPAIEAWAKQIAAGLPAK